MNNSQTPRMYLRNKKRKLSFEKESFQNEIEKEESQVEVLKQRITQLEIQNNFLLNQVWDLRQLIKRVAREGFLQIQDIEEEKKNLGLQLSSLQSHYYCLGQYSGLFDQCVGYWKMIDRKNDK